MIFIVISIHNHSKGEINDDMIDDNTIRNYSFMIYKTPDNIFDINYTSYFLIENQINPIIIF